MAEGKREITVRLSDGRDITLLTELTEEALDEALRDVHDDCGPKQVKEGGEAQREEG